MTKHGHHQSTNKFDSHSPRVRIEHVYDPREGVGALLGSRSGVYQGGATAVEQKEAAVCSRGSVVAYSDAKILFPGKTPLRNTLPSEDGRKSHLAAILGAKVPTLSRFTHLQRLKVANCVKPRSRVEHLVHLHHLGGRVLERNTDHLSNGTRHRASRRYMSSWYPRTPSKFQVMGSSPDEFSIFLTLVPAKIGRDFS